MTETPTRRELNKARTREAIITALRELAQRQPVETITIEELADAAGISRRTFFNYFPSLQAVISDVIGSYTDHLADAIGDLTGPGSPIERLQDILHTVGIPTGLLEWLAVLNLHCAGPSEPQLALERAIWAEKGSWLEQELGRRLPPGTDELYIATLAATVMSCFAAAEQVWLSGRPADAPVDAEAVAAFHVELGRALTYAAGGWTVPPHDRAP